MSSPLSSHSAAPQKTGLLNRPILLGCIGIVALITLALSVGLYWLFTSGKKVITDELREEIVSQIEKSGLPAEQQAALKSEIDRLTNGFQEGEISIKELIKIIEGFEQSPAMSVVRYYQIEGDPLDRESISPEQKKAALHTIRRFIYGVFEERIPDSAVDEILKPFVVDRDYKDDYRDLEFRTDISDQEIFDALAKAKAYADEAAIQDEQLSPDIAREVREVIDRILSQREKSRSS